MIWSNYVNLLYRTIKVFGDYENSIFRTQNNFFSFVGIVYVIAIVFITIPVFSRQATPEELKNMTDVMDPELAQFILNEPSMLVYNIEKDQLVRIQTFGIIVALTGILAIIIVVYYYVNFIKKPKFQKQLTIDTIQMMVKFFFFV